MTANRKSYTRRGTSRTREPSRNNGFLEIRSRRRSTVVCCERPAPASPVVSLASRWRIAILSSWIDQGLASNGSLPVRVPLVKVGPPTIGDREGPSPPQAAKRGEATNRTGAHEPPRGRPHGFLEIRSQRRSTFVRCERPAPGSPVFSLPMLNFQRMSKSWRRPGPFPVACCGHARASPKRPASGGDRKDRASR